MTPAEREEAEFERIQLVAQMQRDRELIEQYRLNEWYYINRAGNDGREDWHPKREVGLVMTHEEKLAQLRDHVRASRDETVEMYERFAQRSRDTNDPERAEYWARAAEEERLRPLPNAS